MSFLGWIILGAIAGAIAKKIVPGEHTGGLFVNIALGVIGGLLGGGISSLLFGIHMGAFFDIRSWVIAILGAAAILALYRYAVPRLGQKDNPASDDKNKPLT